MDTTPTALPSYVTSIIRTGLAVGGGWLIGKGYFTADQIPEIGGILMAVATGIWSLAHKASVSKSLAAAEAAAKGYAQ